MVNQPILVLGAGSWGTALALVLARNNNDVYLWDIDQELVQQLQSSRVNARYIPGVELPNNIHPVESITSVPAETRVFVLATPCHALRASLELLAGFKNKQVCIACKGFEPGTQKLNSAVAQETDADCELGILTGPTFAKEVAKQSPTAVTIAADNLSVAQEFANYFHGETFRVYTHDDVIGAQVGGAVKNVMAIAAGIADGLGFGANTRAALITRGLREITHLGMKLGGRQETFMGLSGLGDLVLTCTDDQSRNRSLGLLLAKGMSVTDASEEIGQAIEGLKSAAEVAELAKTHSLEMPITEQVNNVLQSRCTPAQAVQIFYPAVKRRKTSLLRSPLATLCCADTVH